MDPNFQIDLRHSAGNLHVNLLGEFNGMCAWELLKILRQHGGSGRVFVDTHAVRHVAGDGVELFRAHMTRRQMPSDWLYFKGRKGFKIAPDGSRVLICNKKNPFLDRPPGRSRKTIRMIKNAKQS